MKKHSYNITFNSPVKKEGNLYSFGKVKDIQLAVGMQCAELNFSVGKLYSLDDFVSFTNKLFRDAYRKAHLIHMVTQGSGLKVESITFNIDGESTVISKENDPNGHFPYMFSMLVDRKIALNSEWRELETFILHTTKTALEEDLRFIAMYSFLMSQCREFSIDRFTNLWTAMNAYYCYNRKVFNEQETSKFDIDPFPQKLLLNDSDAEEKGAISWLLGHMYPEVGIQSRIAEIKALWDNNYSIEKALQFYQEEDIKALYNAAFARLNGEELPEKYAILEERAHQFEQELYPFLLIEYPYYWRCKYFHGNRASVLVSAYNDYEMGVLHTINYFLTEFLKAEIPKMFSDNFWSEEKHEDIRRYLRRVRVSENKNGEKKDGYQNAWNEMVKRLKKTN